MKKYKVISEFANLLKNVELGSVLDVYDREAKKRNVKHPKLYWNKKSDVDKINKHNLSEGAHPSYYDIKDYELHLLQDIINDFYDKDGRDETVSLSDVDKLYNESGMNDALYDIVIDATETEPIFEDIALQTYTQSQIDIITSLTDFINKIRHSDHKEPLSSDDVSILYAKKMAKAFSVLVKDILKINYK